MLMDPQPMQPPDSSGKAYLDMPKARILVVDDDERNALAITTVLEELDQILVVARSGEEALRFLLNEDFAVIITDLKMEGVDGLALLRKAKLEMPEAEVVLVTGHGDIKTAVAAMQSGAATYLTKPVDIHELRAVVDKVAERRRLAQANQELRRQLDERFGFEGLVGNSPAMQAVVDRLRQIAPTLAMLDSWESLLDSDIADAVIVVLLVGALVFGLWRILSLLMRVVTVAVLAVLGAAPFTEEVSSKEQWMVLVEVRDGACARVRSPLTHCAAIWAASGEIDQDGGDQAASEYGSSYFFFDGNPAGKKARCEASKEGLGARTVVVDRAWFGPAYARIALGSTGEPAQPCPEED